MAPYQAFHGLVLKIAVITIAYGLIILLTLDILEMTVGLCKTPGSSELLLCGPHVNSPGTRSIKDRARF